MSSYVPAALSKSPELIETTFSMSTIAEEDQQWWTWKKWFRLIQEIYCIKLDHQIEALYQIRTILIHLLNITFFYFTFRLSGSGKELQFGGRARYSKSPELIETTFSMSTIAEEDQQELSSKSGAAIDA